MQLPRRFPCSDLSRVKPRVPAASTAFPEIALAEALTLIDKIDAIDRPQMHLPLLLQSSKPEDLFHQRLACVLAPGVSMPEHNPIWRRKSMSSR